MPDWHLPRALRSRRVRIAALAVLLAAAAAVGWMVSRDGGLPRPATLDTPAKPPVPAPPAPDAPVPAPMVPAPRSSEAEPEEDGPSEPAVAVRPSGAYEPRLQIDDTDLSFARRAGLDHGATPVPLTASAAVVMDLASGKVLYARNELAILPIASLTKLLTGIVLLEARLPMGQRITITREDIDTLRNSRSRLPVGSSLPRQEALRLAMMSSENRAAHALARTYPGGVDAFVAAMNRKAAEIGMADSRFVDPTGLSNRNRATAADVARLVVAAGKYPVLRTYSTTKRREVTVGKQRLQYLNANRLVRYSGWPISLQKTGYIVEAGQCLAMATRVEGRTLVMVLLDSGSAVTRGQDATALRRWAAAQLKAGPAAGGAQGR